jgi:hypothetical protein
MIEFRDAAPDTNVPPSEYRRLLGYPRDAAVSARAEELMQWARAWYAAHGRPWIHARQAGSVALDGDAVRVDGTRFTSARLARTLRDAGADGAVLVAVSAGAELEREAQRCWRDERPDEYFFLEILGSAVVEHLVMMAGARLCAEAEPLGVAVLPHYSPGYPEWEITDQAPLLAKIEAGAARPLPQRLEVLASGMLRPKKSLLAVFGLTRHTERVRQLSDLVPCEGCSLRGCGYRRAPFSRSRIRSEIEGLVGAGAAAEAPVEPLRRDPRYSVNARALRRWAAERLGLEERPDGTLHAVFHYEGSTCSNLGQPLHFVYEVTLGPREDRFPILAQRCSPAAGHDGYTHMCRYRTGAERLMRDIEHDAPLAGRPLDEVLDWERAIGPGCYCEAESRSHKWGLVLETIHHALSVREERRTEPTLQGTRG